MTLPVLPYGRQCVEEDDVAAVVEVLRGDWLTTGPAVRRFESGLEAVLEVPHAVAVANGTAALHLAARALGLGPADQVVVPAVTFLASASAFVLEGVQVVFADVDPDTGLLTAATLEEALTRAPRARAVVPVHINGQCADMVAIQGVAAARGLRVVEDACHALGARYADPGHAVGSCQHADLATFSFHPVKTIAMGEGGAVTTRDTALAERIRLLRNHGMHRDPERFSERASAFAADGSVNPWYYEMPEPGFNYRASDVHCALGASQLAKLPRFVARRRELVTLYDGLLAPLAPVVRTLARVTCTPAWHLYVALIEFDAVGVPRGEVMRRLQQSGVGTQVHYTPLYRQPYYRAHGAVGSLPGCEAYYARCLSLPLYATLADADVQRVVAALGRALEIQP